VRAGLCGTTLKLCEVSIRTEALDESLKRNAKAFED